MISKQDVQKVAKLARINITEKEIERFQKDLSSILDYFELLKRADTGKVKPTFHPSETKENIVRKDDPISSNIEDDLIKQAPDKKDRYIKVRSIFK
jgi:aspartyl-tRNA(Asn)/glutamyl-tRNA(Gln) amidotransferase subunit C